MNFQVTLRSLSKVLFEGVVFAETSTAALLYALSLHAQHADPRDVTVSVKRVTK